MLTPGVVKDAVTGFLNQTNSSEQEKAASIEAFATMIENVVYDAIKSAKITIMTGLVVVSGSPSTQTNAAPIIVENAIT